MKSEQAMHDISSLYDGQLEAGELSRLVEAACADPDLRRQLHRFSLIGDCLRGRPIHVSEEFSQQVMSRIESDAVHSAGLAPERDTNVVSLGDRKTPLQANRSRYRSGLAAAAVFVFGLAVGSLLIPRSADFEGNNPSVAGPGQTSATQSQVATLRSLPAELEPLVAAHGQVTFGKHAGTGFLPYAPQLVIERDFDSRVAR